MTENEIGNPLAKQKSNDNAVYTREVETVISKEQEYLRQRRKKLDIPENDLQDVIGLCISGGGVRAATLALGMMQAFMRARVMEKFDYMSTVSGGGYMGACLSSLMSQEEDYEDEEGAHRVSNDKFDVSKIGLQPENNPLVAMNDKEEYTIPSKTHLSARHQIHHLRTHGEYLTPNKSIFSWDVMRAVGSLFSGIWYNFLLVLSLLVLFVSLHHFLFYLISDGTFFNLIRTTGTLGEATPLDVFNYIGEWYELRMKRNIEIMSTTLVQNPFWGLGFFTIGGLLAFISIGLASALPMRIAKAEFEERNSDQNPILDSKYQRNAGYNLQTSVTHNFRRFFNFTSFALGPILSYITVILMTYLYGTDFNYWLIFTLPFSFSAGLFVISYAVIPTLEFAGYEHSQSRLFRSLFTGMQGSALYGLVLSIVMPIILLFSFTTGVSTDFFLSVFSLVSAYYLLLTRFGSKDSTSLVSKLISNFQRPLINLSIFIFLALVLLIISNILINSGDYFTSLTDSYWVGGEDREVNYFSLLVFTVALLIFYLVGITANVNKMSLHYFYRDRLSEAYLRTDARVQRPDQDDYSIEAQGMPLINLRNHVSLRLKNLGEKNGKAPYHLIIAALNLQGSNDLVKRSLKSDTFIFSKYYIGSNSTGYMATDVYRHGYTRLSSAMTISAAAVSSGMGRLGFAAQYFFMTLFNLRTGYWIQNPWHEYVRYAKLKTNLSLGKRVFRQVGNIITLNHTFWPYYMLKELTGATTARTNRINVSDGGHTGDNLGLIPLLERRCQTIVACDFEEDPLYAFSSFNHAIRIAFTDMNIQIEIDLGDLLPQDTEDGIRKSKSAVAVGAIFYPDRESPGKLIYIKSCLCNGEDNGLPVSLFNYARSQPAFPHESTSDQYFDDAQFEAYRVLGNHIAEQAVGLLTIEEVEED